MRTSALVLAFLLPSIVTAQESAPAAVTHGPILGRLGAHEIGVWARTARPGTFRVRYGTDPGKLDQISNVVQTQFTSDNTGWAHITGLKANTQYYYHLVPGQAEVGAGPGGSFRTLADPDELRDGKLNPRGLFNVRFEFACGNNQTIGQGAGHDGPGFKTMLDQLKGKIDFAIQNGDWLYEDEREYAPAAWMKQVGLTNEADVPAVVKHAPTIVGVWQNYKVYLDRGKNLSNWHREIPSFFTFDDHEMLNDIWGAGTPGLRDRRAVYRDVGVRAWYDYLGWSNPVKFKQPIVLGEAQLKEGGDVLTDPSADFTKVNLKEAATLHIHWGGPTAGVNDNDLDGVGGDPNAGVYEIVEVIDKTSLKVRPAAKKTGKATYSIGRRSYYHFRVSNCDFYALDTRTHREMHDTKQPDKPGLSMLGKEQKAWLMDSMKKSDAEFFFVISSVNFMVPHVGGGKVRADNKDDAWTVFLDEREQLINFFDGIGKPVFVLTGDLHNSFAIKITDRVWEFASGPHNSNNHWYTDEGDRPAAGKFKYGPRECDIRWSTHFRNDIPREELQHPTYCVVQVNNVYNNPLKVGQTRWVAFERPQVVFQYYDGRTGELRYAEAITATAK
jgi:phosphodiesterase/alkaline phosphatase D-like protein